MTPSETAAAPRDNRITGSAEPPELEKAMPLFKKLLPHGKARIEEPPPASQTTSLADFEEIYEGAPLKSAQSGYSILKVWAMAESPHLAGMAPESRRSALLMALDAAGVTVDDILHDAMLRQRALNDYEERQQKTLAAFEAARLEDNRKIQAELDGITAQYMARMQANLDEVARRQDLLRNWQKEKQREARRISDAATVCVPQNAAGREQVNLVFERVVGPRR